MRPLIISQDEQAAIAAALARARAAPIRMADVVRMAIPGDRDQVTLADRRPEHERPPSQFVALPIGFRLALSVEEQPAGMLLHISLSVDAKGKVPHPAAIEMVCEAVLKAYGERLPVVRTWLEEFLVDGKPGGHAINVLFVMKLNEGGSA